MKLRQKVPGKHVLDSENKAIGWCASVKCVTVEVVVSRLRLKAFLGVGGVGVECGGKCRQWILGSRRTLA